MIKRIDNIVILGTSHVAKQSVKEIENSINVLEPEVVAIELDYSRFKRLMSKKEKNEKVDTMKMIKEFGVAGYAFMLAGSYVQKKVGKSLGIEAGIDMKSAYLKAREKKIPTALIDLDIKYTIKKISKLSFARKSSMFFNIIFKSFKKEYRNTLQFDVKKGVPDDEFISKAIGILRKEVPDLYKILIADRNKYMVDKLLALRNNHEGVIIAVVGAGHVEGMYELLEKSINKNGNDGGSLGNGYSATFHIEV